MTFTLPKMTPPRIIAAACVTAFAATLAPFALGQPQRQQQQQPQQQQNAPQEDPVERYVRLVEEANAYERHAAHMQGMIASQQEQLASLAEQSVSLDATSEQIVELMDRMFADIEAFIRADLPFHQDVREQSLSRLRDQILPNLETSISEKFRRLLEIYTIELEYGRTIEAYDGEVNGEPADIVRLGRVSLMYRKKAGGEVGYWDRDQGAWVVNPGYTRDIEAAIRIAKEESVPDLIIVPVPTPNGGRS